MVRCAPGSCRRRVPSGGGRNQQRTGDFAFHHQRHVMPRVVHFPARSVAAWIIRQMLACVPAPAGHVDPAIDCKIAVDQHQFLVVTATDGMDIVELEIDPPLRPPAQQVQQHCPAAEELECPKTPFQDADFQPLSLAGQPVDETAQPARMAFALPLLPPAGPAREVDSRIEVPPDQQDALLGLEHGLLDQFEIGFAIDDQAGPARPGITSDAGFDGPCVAPGVFSLTVIQMPFRFLEPIPSRLPSSPA